MSDKIKILYVDDEPDNLVGFKATLRMDYEIFTALNVADANHVLYKHPDIRMVFCDQRMPGKTGVDFFEDIRVTHPLPVRILLTAYTDIDSTREAINKGNIFRYVKKPWAESDILSAIAEADKFYMANSMLAIRNTELQKAYAELNKFAYSVSHDIRGPISGILGGINIAMDVNDVDEIKEILKLMEKSLTKLDNYIISMHDYYSLQRGELKITEIDFNAIAEEMKSIYMVVSRVKGVSFSITINQEEKFRCDELPLKLIINNLLSNAFKYQEKNSTNKAVELAISVTNNAVEIIVKDTGIGILGSHIREIFNLFYRASSQEPGSGFGLYNVKSALLKLDGQIEVNSVMHQGTTFKVNIPSI